jgi:tetratricopeptide (TPR) repeat protein
MRALLLVFLIAAPALAQESAEDLYRRGSTAYREGRFNEAADLLERAYALQPEPILLYNLARARESAGDVQGAYDAYTRFLAEAPADAEQRPRVTGRVEVLRAEIESRRARATPEPAVPSDPVAPPIPIAPMAHAEPSPVPWIVGGVGVGAVVAGLIVGILAQDRANQAMTAPSHREGTAIASDANTLAITADILFAAGGTVALVGLVWGIFDVIGTSGQARVAIGPGGLRVSGSF